MQIITNNEQLKQLCQELNSEKFITIDLEFLREKTYYAKLCLIQVANTSTSAIIDPLSQNLDLSIFFELIKNPEITKVFHSGRPLRHCAVVASVRLSTSRHRRGNEFCQRTTNGVPLDGTLTPLYQRNAYLQR